MHAEKRHKNRGVGWSAWLLVQNNIWGAAYRLTEVTDSSTQHVGQDMWMVSPHPNPASAPTISGRVPSSG